MDTANDTLENLGIGAFNAQLAKMLRRLKTDIGATTVRQAYRGTGSRAHRRQVWVEAPDLDTDVWLRTDCATFGGISDLRALPPIPYHGRTVAAVYADIVAGLRSVQTHGVAGAIRVLENERLQRTTLAAQSEYLATGVHPGTPKIGSEP